MGENLGLSEITTEDGANEMLKYVPGVKNDAVNVAATSPVQQLPSPLTSTFEGHITRTFRIPTKQAVDSRKKLYYVESEHENAAKSILSTKSIKNNTFNSLAERNPSRSSNTVLGKGPSAEFLERLKIMGMSISNVEIKSKRRNDLSQNKNISSNKWKNNHSLGNGGTQFLDKSPTGDAGQNHNRRTLAPRSSFQRFFSSDTKNNAHNNIQYHNYKNRENVIEDNNFQKIHKSYNITSGSNTENSNLKQHKRNISTFPIQQQILRYDKASTTKATSPFTFPLLLSSQLQNSHKYFRQPITPKVFRFPQNDEKLSSNIHHKKEDTFWPSKVPRHQSHTYFTNANIRGTEGKKKNIMGEEHVVNSFFSNSHLNPSSRLNSQTFFKPISTHIKEFNKETMLRVSNKIESVKHDKFQPFFKGDITENVNSKLKFKHFPREQTSTAIGSLQRNTPVPFTKTTATSSFLVPLPLEPIETTSSRFINYPPLLNNPLKNTFNGEQHTSNKKGLLQINRTPSNRNNQNLHGTSSFSNIGVFGLPITSSLAHFTTNSNRKDKLSKIPTTHIPNVSHISKFHSNGLERESDRQFVPEIKIQFPLVDHLSSINQQITNSKNHNNIKIHPSITNSHIKSSLFSYGTRPNLNSTLFNSPTEFTFPVSSNFNQNINSGSKTPMFASTMYKPNTPSTLTRPQSVFEKFRSKIQNEFGLTKINENPKVTQEIFKHENGFSTNTQIIEDHNAFADNDIVISINEMGNIEDLSPLDKFLSDPLAFKEKFKKGIISPNDPVLINSQILENNASNLGMNSSDVYAHLMSKPSLTFHSGTSFDHIPPLSPDQIDIIKLPPMPSDHQISVYDAVSGRESVVDDSNLRHGTFFSNNDDKLITRNNVQSVQYNKHKYSKPKRNYTVKFPLITNNFSPVRIDTSFNNRYKHSYYKTTYRIRPRYSIPLGMKYIGYNPMFKNPLQPSFMKKYSPNIIYTTKPKGKNEEFAGIPEMIHEHVNKTSGLLINIPRAKDGRVVLQDKTVSSLGMIMNNSAVTYKNVHAIVNPVTNVIVSITDDEQVLNLFSHFENKPSDKNEDTGNNLTYKRENMENSRDILTEDKNRTKNSNEVDNRPMPNPRIVGGNDATFLVNLNHISKNNVSERSFHNNAYSDIELISKLLVEDSTLLDSSNIGELIVLFENYDSIASEDLLDDRIIISKEYSLNQDKDLVSNSDRYGIFTNLNDSRIDITNLYSVPGEPTNIITGKRSRYDGTSPNDYSIGNYKNPTVKQVSASPKSYMNFRSDDAKYSNDIFDIFDKKDTKNLHLLSIDDYDKSEYDKTTIIPVLKLGTQKYGLNGRFHGKGDDYVTNDEHEFVYDAISEHELSNVSEGPNDDYMFLMADEYPFYDNDNPIVNFKNKENDYENPYKDIRQLDAVSHSDNDKVEFNYFDYDVNNKLNSEPSKKNYNTFYDKDNVAQVNITNEATYVNSPTNSWTLFEGLGDVIPITTFRPVLIPSPSVERYSNVSDEYDPNEQPLSITTKTHDQETSHPLYLGYNEANIGLKDQEKIVYFDNLYKPENSLRQNLFNDSLFSTKMEPSTAYNGHSELDVYKGKLLTFPYSRIHKTSNSVKRDSAESSLKYLPRHEFYKQELFVDVLSSNEGKEITEKNTSGDDKLSNYELLSNNFRSIYRENLNSKVNAQPSSISNTKLMISPYRYHAAKVIAPQNYHDKFYREFINPRQTLYLRGSKNLPYSSLSSIRRNREGHNIDNISRHVSLHNSASRQTNFYGGQYDDYKYNYPQSQNSYYTPKQENIKFNVQSQQISNPAITNGSPLSRDLYYGDTSGIKGHLTRPKYIGYGSIPRLNNIGTVLDFDPNTRYSRSVITDTGELAIS